MPDITQGKPLDRLNTLGFPATAEHYAEAADEATLIELLDLATIEGWEVFVLGGGSNVVLTGDVPGLVIRIVGEELTTSAPAPNGAVLVTVEAGMSWHAFVERTLALGLDGLENLALIPGTVGAAPVQNIGAYGVELGERLVELRTLHVPRRRSRVLDAADCAFGYRDSRFKRERGDWIILSATFELGPHRPRVAGYASLSAELGRRGVREPTSRDIADAVIATRRARLPDPDVIGNVGSFFHNPIVTSAESDALAARFPGLVRYPQRDGRVKLGAGWMIDQLGFRGWRENRVGVHEEQALVLVHEGGGSAKALLALVERIRTAVRERFGVSLEIEPLVM